MKNSFFLSLALGTGWLISPESLVIAGNAAGQMGVLTIPVLAIVAILLGISGKCIQQAKLVGNTGSDILLLDKLTGSIPATAILLTSCVPLTILAATALLVSCGYTFNEVFLYWFPNFGFSFLLLALLTLIQLLPERLLLRVQLGFVLTTVTALLFLLLYGISSAHPVMKSVQHSPEVTTFTSALLFLLFAGSSLTEKKQSPLLIPIAGLLLFSLWTVTSLQYVSPQRLASSTIPYMTVARKIMGDPGRQIMGVAVITGSCAAITTLLLICRRILNNQTSSDNSSRTLLSPGKQRWLLPPLLAIISGTLMATGLAGDELLEVLLRGALILWLFQYTCLCLAALLQIRQEKQQLTMAGSVCCIVLLFSLSFLIFKDPHRSELLIFIISMFAAANIAAVGLFYINQRNTSKESKETTSTKENTP